jgi:hypothetical protein
MGIDTMSSLSRVTVADFKRLLRRTFRLDCAVSTQGMAPPPHHLV